MEEESRAPSSASRLKEVENPLAKNISTISVASGQRRRIHNGCKTGTVLAYFRTR